MRPSFGGAFPQMLHISRDPERRHIPQSQLVAFGPCEELHDGLEVSRPGVAISDIGGKEIGQALAGMPRRAAKESRERGLDIPSKLGAVEVSARPRLRRDDRGR